MDETEKGFTLERAINGLQSTDKGIVRQSIIEISKIANRTDISQRVALYEQLEKPLINALQSNVESCREKSINIICSFIKVIEANKNYLTILIPALHNRIGTDDLNEPTEEIRESILNLLDVVLEKYSDHLGPYMEDVVAILNRGVKDEAPTVKRSSCKCIVNLSSLASHEFYPFTKNLIEPLRESIIHQHWRVRVAIIEAIGSVMQYGDSKLMAPETCNALAKRLFDDTPNVRLAVVKVVGSWLLKLGDRYSFFPHLLPHILTSLTDANDEVKQTAFKFWDLIGDQYLSENEKDYKDEIDLGKDTLDHYPSDVVRPRLGCRILVQREAYKFLPAISAELSDWLLNVKIKSAQLLNQVVLHAESKITQHVNKIIPAMAKSASDTEPLVAHYVRLSAYYMGYFVPVDVYTKLIVDHISESPNSGELEMVAALVKGSQTCQLVPHLSSLLHLISNSTTKVPEQIGINSLVKAIMDVCKSDCLCIGDQLWAAIVMNYSLADSDFVSQQSIDLLAYFASLHEDLSKKEVNVIYSRYLLNKLINTSVWTVHCHEQFIFSGAVNIAGEIVGTNIDDMMKILKKSTSEESDAEVILKMLLTCNTIFQEHDITLPSDHLVKTFVTLLIEEVLINQLTWKPGRSAEALRSGATLALLTGLSLYVPTNNEKLIPVILSLVEDAASRTRSLALKTLVELAPYLSSQPENFSKTVQVVLKRLDDCDKGVRELSISTIKSYFKVLNALNDPQEGGISKTVLEFIYSTLLIHLDDQDKSIQTLVLDCLIVLADFDAEILKNKLKKETFRDKQIQEELLKIVDNKISSNKMSNLEEKIENINVDC